MKKAFKKKSSDSIVQAAMAESKKAHLLSISGTHHFVVI